MDEAFKTHKETGFGWMILLRRLRQRAAACGVGRRTAGQARVQALAAATRARPMRYLAPR